MLCLVLVGLANALGQELARVPVQAQTVLHQPLNRLWTIWRGAQPPEPSVALSGERLAVLGRGLETRQLAAGLVLLQDDEEAGLEHLSGLYVRTSDVRVQKLVIEVLVDTAARGWPEDYRGWFLARLSPVVLDASRKHQVPPSVSIAQAVLESGWGRSSLTRHHFNLFGVKAGRSSRRVSMATHEHVRGYLRARRETFRTYASLDESIRHHAELLATDRRYARARGSWTDWRRFLASISPRYASDPLYPRRVSEIVEHYRLDRWDQMIVRANQHDEQVRERERLRAAREAVTVVLGVTRQGADG